jgi:membrane glycosyltransferase
MLPVTIGLLFAIPLAHLTAGDCGALRRTGLLSTPETLCPPAVLRRAMQIRHRLNRRTAAHGEAVERLASDSVLLAAHRRMLPPPRQAGLDPIDADLAVGLVKLSESSTPAAALRWLTQAEKAAILGDRQGLDRLMSLCAVRSRELSAA